jgi:hypothetical protein
MSHLWGAQENVQAHRVDKLEKFRCAPLSMATQYLQVCMDALRNR